MTDVYNFGIIEVTATTLRFQAIGPANNILHEVTFSAADLTLT